MTTETIERDAETALIAVPHGEDAYALFTSKNSSAADKVLRLVRAKIDAFKSDLPSIETASGRKAIASFAHKIAKSKTAIEEVGKELAAEAKDIPRRIDANRKHIRDTLDAWRDEVRQPVTAWEAAEEDRINRIKSDLAEIEGTINDPEWMHRSSECLRDRLGELERQEITEAAFNEYTGAAEELKAKAITTLTERVSIAEKREAEAAELARLRADAEARAKKDREEQIAREAADKARRDAEAKAEAERMAAQKREADLKAAAEKSEQNRKDAEERAANAEKAAKERAEREAREAREREEAEQRRREANKAHKAKINRAAVAAFVSNGIDEETAKTVVKLIATGSVPFVSISY
jgi:hypothetical protein